MATGRLVEDLGSIAAAGGLDAIGYASAEPFSETRTVLEERKAAGLHGGMQFTYRNPARSTDPARTMPGARTLVVGVRSYLRRLPGEVGSDAVGSDAAGSDAAPPSAAAGSRPQARVARYAWSDHYRDLRAGLGGVADRLRADGYRAMVLADDNALVDRAAAVRAGIGWYGNNATVLLPGAGSWYVIGAVLTDADLPTSTPVSPGCGTCRRCAPACPTGALVSPGVLDARRCLAWLIQAPGVFPLAYREAVGDRIYGCDECLDVCPWN
ncbi:MAG TPA: 4Fe-4S double cluster binding domain-containing protein, partial [Acidimicrobiales bacterium]